MINSLYHFSIYSPLSDGVLQHSAALHACRAQKGGEDSDNETDYFCPSVPFHKLYILIFTFLHFLILTFPSACARRRYAYGLTGSV